MRPKTKLHRLIIKLSARLPAVTEKQKAWGYKKEFPYHAYKTKHTAVCFECGHAWKADTNLIAKLTDFVCPACNKILKISESKSWSRSTWNYFKIITTWKGFQVIRIFYITHYCKKGYKANYDCLEVCQHWIADNGKITIVARGSNGMNYWQTGHTSWYWHTSMEIRNWRDNKFYINEAPVYPRVKIQPTIKRNGYDGNFYNLHESWFFHLLLSYPSFETLLKAKQIGLLKEYDPTEERWKKYWPQIKICIRNRYKVKDQSIWFDHIRFLEEEGKDIFSPKYICSKTLKEDHQKIIDKREAARQKEELEQLLERMKKEQKRYASDKAKFFGLTFADDEIKIVVLDHIREFYLEGKTLHHCVYSPIYYEDKNTLIMSARKGDQRLETIDINLKKMEVRQVRGSCNQDSEYHNKICSLLETALPAIAEVHRKKIKKETTLIK